MHMEKEMGKFRGLPKMKGRVLKPPFEVGPVISRGSVMVLFSCEGVSIGFSLVSWLWKYLISVLGTIPQTESN